MKTQLILKIRLNSISDVIKRQKVSVLFSLFFFLHMCSIVHFTANVVKQITFGPHIEKLDWNNMDIFPAIDYFYYFRTQDNMCMKKGV